MLKQRHAAALRANNTALAVRLEQRELASRWEERCFAELLRVPTDWLGGVLPPKHETFAQRGSAGILLYARWFLAQQLVGVLPAYERVVVTRSDFLW